VESESATIGVITTPAEAAQSTANLLMRSGIKGSESFADEHHGPPEIIIRNEYLSVG